MKSIDLKVKRHWGIWALAIAFNLFAIKCLLDEIYLLLFNLYNYMQSIGSEVHASLFLGKFFNSPKFIIFIIVLIADIIVIRDASHIIYNLDDKFLTIKFAIFSKYKVIPLISILEVKGVSLMSFQEFGIHITESSLVAYKITYKANNRRKRASIIVSPKDKELFMEELSSRIDPKVILLNNKESAFVNRQK